MSARHALTLILLFLIIAPVRANPMMPHMAASNAAPSGNGTVLGIDIPQGRLIIHHQELKSLGMPAMTTVFKVRDRSLMKDIEVGDRVGFRAQLVEDGLVVTSLIRDK